MKGLITRRKLSTAAAQHTKPINSSTSGGVETQQIITPCDGRKHFFLCLAGERFFMWDDGESWKIFSYTLPVNWSTFNWPAKSGMFTKSAVNEAADVITAHERLFYKLYTTIRCADRLEILNFIAINLGKICSNREIHFCFAVLWLPFFFLVSRGSWLIWASPSGALRGAAIIWPLVPLLMSFGTLKQSAHASHLISAPCVKNST